MSFLANLNWRFATKKFDKNKKVSQQDLDKILEAVRVVPTSFGLQPFHVFVITDKELKAKIREHSFDQPQVTDCSHLLVFCARIDIDSLVDKYIAAARSAGSYSEDKLAKRKDYLSSQFQSKSETDKWRWAQDQVFIALGFALAACAELKVDSCPMGGFDSGAVDKVLGLPEFMQSAVFLAIGYRSAGPSGPKVRFAADDLFSFY